MVQPTCDELVDDSRSGGLGQEDNSGIQEDHDNVFKRAVSNPSHNNPKASFLAKHQLGIACNSFSAGQCSDEPHSAASFSANGIQGSPSVLGASNDYESPENQTPTLPGRRDTGNFTAYVE